MQLTGIELSIFCLLTCDLPNVHCLILIQIILTPNKSIVIKSASGRPLRIIDVSQSEQVYICKSCNNKQNVAFVRADNDTHDLVRAHAMNTKQLVCSNRYLKVK